MKLSTIALAGALAMTSTFALAQAGGAGSGGAAAIPETSGPATNAQGGVINDRGSINRGTTGMGSGSARVNGRMDSGNPNGDPGGPTSLSGTGSSQFGGSVPGNTGKN